MNACSAGALADAADVKLEVRPTAFALNGHETDATTSRGTKRKTDKTSKTPKLTIP